MLTLTTSCVSCTSAIIRQLADCLGIFNTKIYWHIQHKNSWNMIYVYVIHIMGGFIRWTHMVTRSSEYCLPCPPPFSFSKVPLPCRDYPSLNFLSRLEHALKIDHLMIYHISIIFAMNVWIIKQSTSFHMTTLCFLHIFTQNGFPFNVVFVFT